MKTIFKKLVFLLFLGYQYLAKACEACDLQQPKITRGLTHGPGPKNMFEWMAVIAILIISVLTVYYFIKYLIKPDPQKTDKLKNNVLHF